MLLKCFGLDGLCGQFVGCQLRGYRLCYQDNMRNLSPLIPGTTEQQQSIRLGPLQLPHPPGEVPSLDWDWHIAQMLVRQWQSSDGSPGQSSAQSWRLSMSSPRVGRAWLLAAAAATVELRSSVGETQFVGSVLQLLHHILTQSLPWPVGYSAVSILFILSYNLIQPINIYTQDAHM